MNNLSNNASDTPLVLRQGIIYPIMMITGAPILFTVIFSILFLILLSILVNTSPGYVNIFPYVIVIYILLLISFISYFNLTLNTYILDNEALVIKNKLKEIKIRWSDVVSLEPVVSFSTKQIEYQLKTINGIHRFHPPSKFESFKNFIDNLGIFTSEDVYNLSFINFLYAGPQIKRWTIKNSTSVSNSSTNAILSPQT